MSTIRFEIIDRIAHFVITAPPGNAMGKEFFDDFMRLKENVFRSVDISGMIVYGEGRHFSSGADLAEITALSKAGTAQAQAALDQHSGCFLALEQMNVPVVAAISGCCLGSGLELALACHYRIAAERSVFALPETGYGLIPGCGGTIRLPRIIGTGAALHMILTGNPMDTEDALRAGLVDATCLRHELISTAVAFIHRLAGTISHA